MMGLAYRVHSNKYDSEVGEPFPLTELGFQAACDLAAHLNRRQRIYAGYEVRLSWVDTVPGGFPPVIHRGEQLCLAM